MNARKPKPLAVAEAKVRQFLLMVGFGFMAYIAGSLFSASLIMRLRDRILAADSVVLIFFVQAVVGRLWILAVFPVLVYLTARFLDLPLWRTAIIGALTGELFASAIQIASSGAEDAFGDWIQNGVRLVTLVGGVLLTVWAGKQGRAVASVRQQAAAKEAADRKAQYDEFLARSTALADRRDAAPIVAPNALPATPSAAAEAPRDAAPTPATASGEAPAPGPSSDPKP